MNDIFCTSARTKIQTGPLNGEFGTDGSVKHTDGKSGQPMFIHRGRTSIQTWLLDGKKGLNILSTYVHTYCRGRTSIQTLLACTFGSILCIAQVNQALL